MVATRENISLRKNAKKIDAIREKINEWIDNGYVSKAGKNRF